MAENIQMKIVQIPSSIFKDRTLSVLEAMVEYLKEKQNLTYHQIALLLNRDERNIWTVYSRAKKKRGNQRSWLFGLFKNYWRHAYSKARKEEKSTPSPKAKYHAYQKLMRSTED